MLNIIPPQYYFTVYLILLGFLSFIQINSLINCSNGSLLSRENGRNYFFYSLILSLFFIIFFGLRDPYSPYFVDTVGYTGRYQSVARLGINSPWYVELGEGNESLWGFVMVRLAIAQYDVSVWYLIVAMSYILPIVFALKILFPSQVYLATLFAFLNFGFYGGAVNGIRNSVALSLVLLAISLLVNNQRRFVIPILIMLMAYAVHTSTILPSLCALVSVYFIKKPKYSILIWICCFFLSLIIGNTLSNFFGNLGFDDRMSSYIITEGKKITYKIGFRLDFITYSIVPIIWGWWVIYIKGVTDKGYNIIYNTYVLANSFWLLVIRASFSNRFAALSWFLYFVVLIYPLLRFNITRNQGQILLLMLVGSFLIDIII